MSLALIALTAFTLFLVGANNASNSAGTIAGSKIISYRNGILIFIAGFTAGLLLEGGKLAGSIQGGAILSPLDALSVTIVMGITLAMVAMATFARIPLPITQAVFGASVGSAVYLGIPLNGAYVALVLGSWLMTPFIAALVALVAGMFLRRFSVDSLGGRMMVFGILLLVASFFTAYVFGANTLGLIVGVIGGDLGAMEGRILAIAATAAGGILVGERVSKMVGEGLSNLGPPTAFASQIGGALTVQLFTELSVPVSISQAIVGGVAGGGLSKGGRALSRDNAVKLGLFWIVTPVVSLLLALLLHAVMLG
jgi:PiT family inorganic phosphate transporter